MVSQEDGSLEYGEIKFLPKVTGQFKPQEEASVFMQIYLPKGKIEIRPEFQVLGESDLSNFVRGELIAESWNNRSKVWSGIFKLNLDTVDIGESTLKIEIPISEEKAVISKEVKLTRISF